MKSKNWKHSFETFTRAQPLTMKIVMIPLRNSQEKILRKSTKVLVFSFLIRVRVVVLEFF